MLEERRCCCHPPLLLLSSPSLVLPLPPCLHCLPIMTSANDVRHPDARRHQSCTRHLTAFVMFYRASIAAAATVSAQGVFSTLFFGDLRCPCWAMIRSMATTSEPFCSHGRGIESLVAAFALHATKKRVAFSARLLTLYSFLFEDMLKC